MGPTSKQLNDDAFDQLFLKARTYRTFLPDRVDDRLLHQIYEVMKWGPTSANCCPARIVFVKSQEAREKLIPCLDKGNIDKVKSAPVTAIIAQDMEFYELMPKLAPHGDVKSYFAGKPKLIADTAFRNSSLQGGYLMLAARALGLDCGPMSGFDNDKVDAAFFAGTSWKSNFLCNLGYGDATQLFPRQPRLSFEESAQIL